MTCSKCGNVSPRSSNFCNYCGAEFVDKKFSKHASEALYKRKKYYDFQTPIFLSICIIIVVIIIIIIVPAIKKFAENKFKDSTFVYASVERSYKEKCDDETFKTLENQKGGRKEQFVKMSGKVLNMYEKEQSIVFEVAVTQNEDNSYGDLVSVEYNDILDKIKVNDMIIFWGKDRSCGSNKSDFKDGDPRIAVEYITIINQMAFI